MSGEAERATAIRAEQEAEERAALRELLAARLGEAMDEHEHGADSSRCACGYVEPYGLGIGLHQLEAAADAVLDLIADAEARGAARVSCEAATYGGDQ